MFMRSKPSLNQKNLKAFLFRVATKVARLVRGKPLNPRRGHQI
jgi:hypothetical protein